MEPLSAIRSSFISIAKFYNKPNFWKLDERNMLIGNFYGSQILAVESNDVDNNCMIYAGSKIPMPTPMILFSGNIKYINDDKPVIESITDISLQEMDVSKLQSNRMLNANVLKGINLRRGRVIGNTIDDPDAPKPLPFIAQPMPFTFQSFGTTSTFGGVKRKYDEILPAVCTNPDKVKLDVDNDEKIFAYAQRGFEKPRRGNRMQDIKPIITTVPISNLQQQPTTSSQQENVFAQTMQPIVASLNFTPKNEFQNATIKNGDYLDKISKVTVDQLPESYSQKYYRTFNSAPIGTEWLLGQVSVRANYQPIPASDLVSQIQDLNEDIGVPFENDQLQLLTTSKRNGEEFLVKLAPPSAAYLNYLLRFGYIRGIYRIIR